MTEADKSERRRKKRAVTKHVDRVEVLIAEQETTEAVKEEGRRLTRAFEDYRDSVRAYHGTLESGAEEVLVESFNVICSRYAEALFAVEEYPLQLELVAITPSSTPSVSLDETPVIIPEVPTLEEVMEEPMTEFPLLPHQAVITDTDEEKEEMENDEEDVEEAGIEEMDKEDDEEESNEENSEEEIEEVTEFPLLPHNPPDKDIVLVVNDEKNPGFNSVFNHVTYWQDNGEVLHGYKTDRHYWIVTAVLVGDPEVCQTVQLRRGSSPGRERSVKLSAE
jgi:hypothetical protein